MKRILSFILVALCILPVFANVDEARKQIEKGDFQAAVKTLEPVLKKTPNDANANYLMAQAQLGLNNRAAWLKSLKTAAAKGHLEAFPQLVEEYILTYDVDEAENAIDDWKAALAKAKKPQPSELGELENKLLLMSNQLNRVEDIPIIARYDVSRREMDAALNNLTQRVADKGISFLSADIPFYVNNMAREVFWTQPDENGVNRLFTAGVLDDGTRETPVELTKYIGDGNIIAPFMLEDGETLYFASDRDDGLGGYDIYMTRRDGEGGFYEPSNIGMPYNSPDDDFLFVIDEPNNIGWWVTDRFIGPDSVSVLIFEPMAERVNVPADVENIAERAYIKDIAASHPQGYDAKAALGRLSQPQNTQRNRVGGSSFSLSLGDGRVITSMSQFRNRNAASIMSEVLRATRTLDDMKVRLDNMRAGFASGDKSLSNDILSLEQEIERGQKDLRTLTNRVIKLETGQRD